MPKHYIGKDWWPLKPKVSGAEPSTFELPPVLDACCGSRMFWFDKADPRALFVDKRRETLMDFTGKKPASIVVNPDVLADFKALPFPDDSFTLVVFDPPHTWSGPNGRTIKKYGTLPLDWRYELLTGFRECFRVLCPLGTLIFKWNEHRVRLKTVLSLTDQQPLFGQRIGNTRTHWIVFHKSPPESKKELRSVTPEAKAKFLAALGEIRRGGAAR